jgi:hypothetical protein
LRVIVPQQLMIEFADRFERRLELVIMGKPTAHLADALGPQTELARAPARIAHGEDGERMAFAARALGAACGMIA